MWAYRVVSSIAQRVVVLRAGSVVEAGYTKDVLEHPQHPYTKQLLRVLPRMPGVTPPGDTGPDPQATTRSEKWQPSSTAASTTSPS